MKRHLGTRDQRRCAVASLHVAAQPTLLWHGHAQHAALILFSLMSANPYLVSGQVDKHGPRGFARTPSPTPSETAALLDDGKIHPEKLLLKENRSAWLPPPS
jgi:hypothetical protein